MQQNELEKYRQAARASPVAWLDTLGGLGICENKGQWSANQRFTCGLATGQEKSALVIKGFFTAPLLSKNGFLILPSKPDMILIGGDPSTGEYITSIGGIKHVFLQATQANRRAVQAAVFKRLISLDGKKTRGHVMRFNNQQTGE